MFYSGTCMPNMHAFVDTYMNIYLTVDPWPLGVPCVTFASARKTKVVLLLVLWLLLVLLLLILILLLITSPLLLLLPQ